MITRRILTFILGIIMIVDGVICLFNPEMTYMGVGYVAGIMMIMEGVGAIILWFEIKRLYNKANGWALAAAILSLVFGVLVVGNSAMQAALDMTILYFIAAWLVALGILSIVLSIRIKNIRTENDTEYLGRHWWLMTITGVLMIICGIISFINPAGLMTTIGIQLGLAIIVAGANLITLGV